MEYKDFFSPKTIEKLNKKSAENLKTMLGDKNLMQTMMSSQQLLSQISKAEAPYKSQLEKLAVDMIKELYPIIDEEGIVLDAKIGDIGSVTGELDEIKVNNPIKFVKLNLPSNLNKTINLEKYQEFDTIIKILKKLNPNIPNNLFYESNHSIWDDVYDDLENNENINEIPLNTFLNSYFYWLYANLAYEKREKDISDFHDYYSSRDQKTFVDNALKGKWVLFDKITDFTDHKLDEIKVNILGNIIIGSKELDDDGYEYFWISEELVLKYLLPFYPQYKQMIIDWVEELNEWGASEEDLKTTLSQLKTDFKTWKENEELLTESISPESRRRIINSITQGAALRGAFAFYLFKEHLDDLDPSLVEKYNQIMKNSFGIYDDENAIAMMLSLLAQGQKMAGGSSKVIIKEQESGITIKARAINFPMLVHELIKGLYELISLQGFKGSKEARQAVVDKVDLLKNEPSDIRYGKFIFDALNNVFASSEYDDSRIREFFFTEVYKLDDDDFILFIENAINEELTATQQKWVNDTLRDIASDLKADDYEATGLDEIKTSKPLAESFLTSFNKDIRTFINNNLNEYSQIISKSLLNEYSDKTITTTIERWKTTDPNIDENVAKQLIQRFDQIKGSLSQKLNIVVLSDELKKGNNYLNIDKYSYGDMVNLIKSLPENEEKIKKDAVKKFIEKEQIDRNTAQSYVARFMDNRKKLKFGAKEGLEDAGFTKEEVLNYIPKQLQRQDAFFDPRNWNWALFEQMLDALFPSQKTASEEGEENLVSTGANKMYDKGGIEIYKGDDVEKCISYNPTDPETKRKKYGWCVTQVRNTNYDYYRFQEKSPTFYFVFDRSKSSSPQHAPFDDEWHAFVVQVTADNKEYIITGANNRGDIPVNSWEGISKVVPSDTWAKIKGLKDYFKPISLSAVERGRKFASGKNLSVDEFKELSEDEKILYIQGKASKNALTSSILSILPQYKINLGGRSTTLANIAMDNRQKFPYSTLKDSEALAKRYAIVSSRHFPDDPLPLPFIKYLDEDAKQKYLEKYDENLTFEYIEKYFGPKSAEKYVNEQVKKLDYLPQAASKYIKDPQLKKLYSVYLKLFDSWEFDSNTNLSEEDLNKIENMPEQIINPKPINQKQWSNLTTPERKIIIDLTEKYNKNTKYLTLLYSLPFIIKYNGKKYVLLPESNLDYNYDSWALMDENGKIIKNNISGDTQLNNTPLTTGYPDATTGYNRIYDIKDLKKND